MNWDWDKLQEKRQRQGRGPSFGGSGGGNGGGGGDFPGPDWDQLGKSLNSFKSFKFPAGRIAIGLVLLLWALSGVYIVEPDEQGVVLRFGAFDRLTEPGPHYHLPFPVESVLTPKISQIKRIEIGFRSYSRASEFRNDDYRMVPEESLMLTGDENIVDVQFIVQYQIRDSKDFLFNVSGQTETVKAAAEAAMREVVGHAKIDDVLTKEKLAIQIKTHDLLQEILDRYEAGLRVASVQLQDVHPPREVVDAFKDVASAREDKIRFINEAEAYENDVLPKARGEAARQLNQAEAYKQTVIRRAKGESDRFLSVLEEYKKAPDVTRERLYIEAMQTILQNPELSTIVLSDEALKTAVPYLPLNQLPKSKTTPQSSAQGTTTGASQ